MPARQPVIFDRSAQHAELVSAYRHYNVNVHMLDPNRSGDANLFSRFKRDDTLLANHHGRGKLVARGEKLCRNPRL